MRVRTRVAVVLTLGALGAAASLPAGATLPWATPEPARPQAPAVKPAPSLTDALVSVGELGHELKQPIVDRALDRAQGLILLATGCAAGLIVLHALLRRWTARRDHA